MYTIVCVCSCCGFHVFLSFCFAFNGAKNGLNILSINSLSQNISFLCTFLFLSLLYSIPYVSACSFQFPRKNFMFSFIFSLLNIFLSLSHCEKKIISFLQSREFLVSPLCLNVCIMEWVCGGVVEICSVLLVHFFVCLFVCCWDVLLCLFSLLSNKSHSFSWTWHLELYFFYSLITFIISYQ